MSQHTPGPWSVVGNGHCVIGPAPVDMPPQPGTTLPNTAGVCMCSMARRTREENEANARLIAAAPDLLEALIAFRNAAPMAFNYAANGVYAQARAALAKAIDSLPPLPDT